MNLREWPCENINWICHQSSKITRRKHLQYGDSYSGGDEAVHAFKVSGIMIIKVSKEKDTWVKGSNPTGSYWMKNKKMSKYFLEIRIVK